MSHTLSKVNVGNNAVAVIKIVNYVQGGESFTLAELGLTGGAPVAIIPLIDPTSNIVPQYQGGGVVKLFGNNGSDIPDLASTTNLNFVFAVMVVGVN